MRKRDQNRGHSYNIKTLRGGINLHNATQKINLNQCDQIF